MCRGADGGLRAASAPTKIRRIGAALTHLRNQHLHGGCSPVRQFPIVRPLACFLRARTRMKPPPFEYYDPTTIAEVVGLLGRLENAKLLAGGQSLMPMLNMRFVLPDHVVDLNRVQGLSYIREANGAIEIGAMTRQRDLEFSDVVGVRCPLMHEAIQQIGHRQTRNRGTIGGSLCHLDPAAELVSIAAALDATVTVAGP